VNLGEWGFSPEPEPEVFEYKKPKQKNIFEVMNSCITKKMKPTTKEKKSINEFLFHNILSNNESSLELALILTTHNIPIERQYDLVNIIMPKGYIPYPSKKKQQENEIVEKISDYYNCSMTVAKEYMNLMDEKEINRIVETFNEGKI